MDEEVLTGGNSTVVVRVGATVRRTAGPWTPSVRRLLDLLHAADIAEVPRHHGLDELGREVWASCPGEVAGYPQPSWLWESWIVSESARLLRRIHDASVPLVEEQLSWQLPGHQPAEVVCHNDVAPYNMVFREGHLAGIIDFDTSSPGPRIWDLAYLAYRLAPFAEDAGPSAPAGAGRLARLDLLINAYGLDFSPAEVLRVAADRLDDLARYTDQRALDTGRAEFGEHAAMYRRDRIRLAALVSELEATA